MLDIPSISAIIAAAGVLVGVVLTVQELRHLAKSRRTDSFWSVFSSFNSKEYLEAWAKVYSLKFKDYNDFKNKYGIITVENPTSVALSMVANLFEGAAYLLRNGLIEFDVVREFPVSPTWEKMRPIAEGAREELGWSGLWGGFEQLAQEMKKRQQQLQQKGVKSG
jgi:hypothetical protein